MKVTILGSGCTAGTPKPGCKCRTCEWARANGFERKRFSCLIESNGKKVLIDAGPDLRSQMLDNNFSTLDLEAVIITHEHYDHCAGLGEFRSFNKQTHCYCLPETARELKTEFGHLIPDFLLLNEKELGEQFKVAEFKVTLFDAKHGLPCAGIVIETEGKKAVFLPDSRLELGEDAEELIQGADLLVIDAYTENETQIREVLSDFFTQERIELEFKDNRITHGIISKAIELSKRLKVKSAVAVHLSHRVRPHPELVKTYEDENFRIGFDGMQIEL